MLLAALTAALLSCAVAGPTDQADPESWRYYMRAQGRVRCPNPSLTPVGKIYLADSDFGRPSRAYGWFKGLRPIGNLNNGYFDVGGKMTDDPDGYFGVDVIEPMLVVEATCGGQSRNSQFELPCPKEWEKQKEYLNLDFVLQTSTKAAWASGSCSIRWRRP